MERTQHAGVLVQPRGRGELLEQEVVYHCTEDQPSLKSRYTMYCTCTYNNCYMCVTFLR